VCSLPTPRGRVTLSDRLLVVTEDGERTERTLASDEEVLERYRELFGITLERPPTLASPVVRPPTPAAPGPAAAVSSPGD
jgi:N-hydroxyarylamine O-acetyltransferase